MPALTGYNALLDVLRKTPASNPKGFLTELQAAYKLRHVLYGDLIRADGVLRPGTLIHAYDPDLERLIRDNGTAVLQPLFEAAGRLFGPSILPPDDLPRLENAARFPGSHGCTDRAVLIIPLVPSRPGVAFFACNTGRLADLVEGYQELLRDLAALSGLFHAKQLAAAMPSPGINQGTPGEPRLTPREREVLQWVAAGKTYWEISRILGISQRTVRHFMAVSREKLDSVSNKQAVAKAVAGRLIEVGPSAPR